MQKIEKSKKSLIHGILIILSILLIASSLSTSFAADQSINDTTTGGIAGALNNTVNGDTITLAPGFYNKNNQDNNVVINKSITIQGNGSPETVKLDGNYSGNTHNDARIFIMANNINVKFINLTFQNAFIYGNGGAIYNTNTNTTMTFENCIFLNNTAGVSQLSRGGAIFNMGPNLTVTNCVFDDNLAYIPYTYSGGGAIYNMGNNMQVSNSIFTNNHAEARGGAIYNINCTNATISNSTFSDNTAFYYAPAINNDNANMYVTDCIFSNNRVSFYGGGAILNSANGNMTIEYSNFTNNSATAYGGGVIINERAYLKLSNCNFMDNNASSINGGAIFCNYGRLVVEWCNFTNNIGRNGGAIYSNSSNITVESSNFIANIATYGAALYMNFGNANFTYNRLVNNSDSTNRQIYINNGYINASSNWWGDNKDPLTNYIYINNTSAIVIVDNYYTMIFNSSDTMNKAYGDNLTANYYFVLNNTSDSTGVNLLPDFNTTIYYNGNEINIFDARYSKTVIIQLTTVGLNINISAVTDNEVQSIFLDVSKAITNTTIVIPNNIKVGKTFNITGVARDLNGNPIANTNITVTFNGVSYNVTTNNDGSWVLPYTPTHDGNISVSVNWTGNNTLLGFTNSSVFNVEKIISNSTIVLPANIRAGQKINITGVATDEFGNPIANADITVTVNGVSYNVTTSSDGSWVLPYKVTTVANLAVKINWAGNNTYLGFTNNTSANVSKGNINVKITVVKNPDGSVTIIANATDENGDPVISHPVDFFLNGKLVGTGITDINGLANITIPANQLKNGKNSIKVVVSGGENYYDGIGLAEFIISSGNNKTNDTNNNFNKYSDYSTTKTVASKEAVSMKKTGIPIIAIVLLLLSIFGISVNRKPKK